MSFYTTVNNTFSLCWQCHNIKIALFFLGDATGYYAYVEASVGNTYSLAVLESPVLKQAAATCQMNFWYHMYGTGIGDLRVYVQVGTTLTLLWERSGNQGLCFEICLYVFGS